MKFLNGNRDLNNVKIVLVGKVVGLHGIKGMVKVTPFSESLLSYTLSNELLVKTLGNYKLTSMQVVWANSYKRWLRICFKGIKSRTNAEFLVGSKIYVRRSVLPPLEDDTYFWSDLIGMSVKSISGKIIGDIDHIIRTGSNDVYVVKSNKIGVKEEEVLIPAIKSVILSVNVMSNLMLVDLPDGIKDSSS